MSVTTDNVVSEQWVKPILGLLTSIPDQTESVYDEVIAELGPVDFHTDWIPFESTTYYQEEMGSKLQRQFISFSNLIDPSRLADIKCLTNRLEQRFSQNKKRRFNLDPGYLSSAKLVLATTKNFAHRIYLHSGIFAEITLTYRGRRFHAQEWTYPDYRTPVYLQIFEKIRQKYLNQLSQISSLDSTDHSYSNRRLNLIGKTPKYAIGLMSGTSADGVDAALVSIKGSGKSTQAELICSICYPYPVELHQRIFNLFQTEQSRVDELCQVNFLVGQIFAEAATRVVEIANFDLKNIDFIGSHGQTIYHLPPTEIGTASTLQIGESAVIANQTNLPVVSDFRVADIALGGHGAPVVPYVDFLIHNQDEKSVALQNIGGISNVTFIPKNAGPEDIIAFDSGPGNMIIDATIEIVTNGQKKYDEDGMMADQGQVNKGLLDILLKHPYLKLPPPKSTGRESFGWAFAQKTVESAKKLGISDCDLLATVTFFTTQTIVNHYQDHIPFLIDEIRVSGGGSHNRTLMKNLSTLAEDMFKSVSVIVDEQPDAKEAIAFAILANETLVGHCSNLPNVTGSIRPTILGKITPVPHKIL